MQQLIFSQSAEIEELYNEIDELNGILTEAGIIIQPTTPDNETTDSATDDSGTSGDNVTENDTAEDTTSDDTENSTTSESDVPTEGETQETAEEGGNASE